VNFLSKKAVLGEKNVFAYNSRTGRDISKIPTDLDSAGQKHLFYVNFKNF
jgi:hypothetical protein